MTVLEWFGEIGWELWAPELRAQLKASKGDDLTIKFSSVGGSIFEGGDIFNMLADHRRDNPKIKMNLEIKSTALSMGSAIASSPVWDDISIEQTSMYMLHNPWTIAIGDFDEMQSSADFLKSARDMFAKIYSKKSKQSIDDTIDAMSTETWFFGQEIIDAGFANRMNESVSSADPQDKIIAFKTASVKFEDMKKRQKILNKGEDFDEERAVACLGLGKIKMQKTADAGGGVNKIIKPVQSGKLTEDIMNKAELKKDNPAVYDDTVQDGMKIERDRVKELTAMKARDEYKDIPEVWVVIDKAIDEGQQPDEVQPLIMAALLKIQNDPAKAKAAEQESPGDIQGGNEQNTGIKTKRIREV